MRRRKSDCGPVRPIRGRGKARIEKGAVDVRIALDGVALVEMGMNVDQRRPDLAATDVDTRNPVIACSSAGRSMRASLPSSISKSALTTPSASTGVGNAMPSANQTQAGTRAFASQ